MNPDMSWSLMSTTVRCHPTQTRASFGHSLKREITLTIINRLNQYTMKNISFEKGRLRTTAGTWAIFPVVQIYFSKILCMQENGDMRVGAYHFRVEVEFLKLRGFIFEVRFETKYWDEEDELPFW